MVSQQLKIYTLGGLRIHLNGKPVGGFVSRKVEALFVYLVANPREFPREILAELLWDDLSQERTMANLRTALSDLQKQLGDYLSITRNSLSINPEANIWLDVRELDEALLTAENQWRKQGELSRIAVTQLDEALHNYSGAFLEGFYVKNARGFEGWRMLEQERLQGQILDVLQMLGDYTMRRGLYAQGIDYANRLLQIDPLWEQAHRQLMTLQALSGQRSAAIAQYEACKRILWEDLEVDPEDETNELYDRIMAGEFKETPLTLDIPNNLITPSTAFVPRPDIQEQIADSMTRSECRLLTLLGQGGSGKTRLATETAFSQLVNFPNGVFYVSLTSSTDVEGMIQAVCTALNIVTDTGHLETALFNYLRDKELLLVLDNIEHILDSVTLVSRILAASPYVKILTTSRERLNLREEWVIPVEGMPVPQDVSVENLEEWPSIQLFLQNAYRVKPDFEFTGPACAQQRAAVVEICRFVLGSPLAIELASSWVRSMSCAQILTELRKSLDFLYTSLRNVPERHRSMRAVFEWSWGLLKPQGRKALMQCVVFRGGFTADAAQAITGVSMFELSTLVDQSFLYMEDGRYAVHELLHQFIEEKLDENLEDKVQTQRRHAGYYVEFLTSREKELEYLLKNNSFTDVQREAGNILLAWQTLLDARDQTAIAQCVRPLFHYHAILSYFEEGMTLFRRAMTVLEIDKADPLDADPLDADPLDIVGAQILLYWGSMQCSIMRFEAGESAIQRALPVLEARNYQYDLRLACANLAVIAYSQGQYDTAWHYYERAADIARDIGYNPGFISAMFRLSDIATVQGNYKMARSLLEECRFALEDGATEYEKSRWLITLGDIQCKQGDFESAGLTFTNAADIARRIHSEGTLGVALISLARVAYGKGDYQEAQVLCRESITIFDEAQNTWGKAFALAHLGRVYYRMGENVGARYHLQNSLNLSDSIGSRWIESFALRQLGRIPSYTQLVEPYLVSALQIAVEIKATPLILDALVGVAQAAAGHSMFDFAYEIAQAVKRNPVSEYETLQDATAVIRTIEQAISAAIKERLHTQAASMTLDDLVQKVLDALPEPMRG